jgi:hypothetical protein
MKKYLEKITKGGLLVTIGGHNIDFPILDVWGSSDPIGALLEDGVDIINLLITFSSVVAVAMIIVSGYKLITAAGDPDKIDSGQKTLTAAVVGLVIVWIVGLIIKFVLTQMRYI